MAAYEIKIWLMLVPALIASVYGLAVIFPKTKSLYYRMPVLAMVCNAAGQLSYYVLLESGNEFENIFNVGCLGPMGASLFFLAANVGAVTKFIDEGKKNYRTYRIVALAAPAVILGMFVITYLSLYFDGSAAQYTDYYIAGCVSFFLVSSTSAFSAYYTMKAVLLPDIKNGFVSSMRPYNIVLTLLLVLFNVERIVRYKTVNSVADSVLFFGFYIILGLLVILVLPLLERGRKKFLTV